MSYEVFIRRRASKELADLPLRDYERVKASIFALGEDLRPQGCLKLAGRPGWRIRVGDYRVIYPQAPAEDNVRHTFSLSFVR